MGTGDNSDLKQDDVRVGVVIADSYEKKDLGPLSGEDAPKILQPLAGRSFLFYTLSLLLNSGVKEVIVFSSRFAQTIRSYLKEESCASRFRKSMKIEVIGNEDACSLGDAMRHIYEAGLVRGNFILTIGPVVGNVNLAKVLEEHKARAKDDKELTMTMVFKQALPGHHLRSEEDQVLLATLPKNNQILHHAQAGNGAKVDFPLELFSRAPQVDIKFDSITTGVSICSPSVPGLFADNFDCQTMQDFVKSCIEDDLADHNLYAKVFNEGYLARVTDANSYLAVTRDVLNRWTHPIVPDAPQYTLGGHQVYKGKGVKVGDTAVLSQDVIIGQGSSVGADVVLSSVALDRNVRVGDGARISNSIIHENTTIEKGAQMDQVLLGRGCVIGGGAKIGTKCVLGPGVQIGSGVTVPSGTWLVSEDEFEESATGKYGPKAFVYQHPENDESDEDEDEEDKDQGEDRQCDVYGVDRWGRGDVSDDDYESSDSEAESEMGSSMMGGGELIDDEDRKTNIFVGEITESLQRGIEEGVDANNLVLEINSSRHAYAMTASQVIQHVTTAVVKISTVTKGGDTKNNKVILSTVKMNLTKVKHVFANYVKTPNDQRDVLKGLESFLIESPDKLVLAAHIIKHLYEDLDLLEDDAVVEWWEGLGASKNREHQEFDDDTEQTTDPEFFATLKRTLEPLIDWLQESSEEEDDESD